MCPLEKVDTVPTDEHIDDDSCKMLSDAGVELIIAG